MQCLNCQQTITDNFCSNCGQKRYKRIDKKYILDELQYTILHTNKGFLYSVKNTLKNPGKTARSFIDGNRVNHYKPILLVFVLSGISTFISYKVIGLQEIFLKMYAGQQMNSPFMNDYLSFLSSYNTLVMLMTVPFLAFISRLVFKKWNHNYYEHIVMNTYVLSFYIIFNIVLVYPFVYMFRKDLDILVPLTSFAIIFLPFILVWFFKEFYQELSLKQVIGRVVRMVVYTIIGLFILSILGIIIVVVLAMLKGPEGMEYLKPAG